MLALKKFCQNILKWLKILENDQGIIGWAGIIPRLGGASAPGQFAHIIIFPDNKASMKHQRQSLKAAGNIIVIMKNSMQLVEAKNFMMCKSSIDCLNNKRKNNEKKYIII